MGREGDGDVVIGTTSQRSRGAINWPELHFVVGISTFQSCPLRWNFRYALGLPEEVVSSSLVFGGAIHRAAELHYRELLSGNAAPDLDALLYEYQAAWRDRDLDGVKFGKSEDVNTLGGLAERVLKAFMESPLS